jgi:hypothetical protein
MGQNGDDNLEEVYGRVETDESGMPMLRPDQEMMEDVKNQITNDSGGIGKKVSSHYQQKNSLHNMPLRGPGAQQPEAQNHNQGSLISNQQVNMQNPVAQLILAAEKTESKLKIELPFPMISKDLYRVLKASYKDSEDIIINTILSSVNSEQFTEAIKAELRKFYEEQKSE